MKVTLISHTENPLRAICIAVASMKEKDPIKAVDSMSTDRQKAYCDEIFKSKLRGALEFAHFEFMVEGVTRAFTHQLVRHRTMSFSQQSMRFFDASESGFKMPKVSQELQETMEDHYRLTSLTYRSLLERGCPIEDARSILPTNVQTLISFSSSFRGLVDMAEVRLCLQSQGEFREVMVAIKNEIRDKVSPYLADQLKISCQWEGKCGFESIFDRDCPLKHDLKKGA